MSNTLRAPFPPAVTFFPTAETLPRYASENGDVTGLQPIRIQCTLTRWFLIMNGAVPVSIRVNPAHFPSVASGIINQGQRIKTKYTLNSEHLINMNTRLFLFLILSLILAAGCT